MNCQCGCGEDAGVWPGTDRPRGRVAGEPKRYIAGHRHRSLGPAYVIDPETGCWVWQRTKSPAGYGLAWNGEKEVQAHVLMYEQHVVAVPDGLELDHLCSNPSCVNPAHLEPVTHAENCRRAYARRPRRRGAGGRFVAAV